MLIYQKVIGNEIIDSGPLSGGVYSEDGMMLVYHGTAYHCTYTNIIHLP